MTEENFIHDLSNKVTILSGYIGKIIRKADQLSPDEIKSLASQAQNNLKDIISSLNKRKQDLEDET